MCCKWAVGQLEMKEKVGNLQVKWYEKVILGKSRSCLTYYRKTCNRGALPSNSLEHHISTVFEDTKIYSTEEIFYEY